MGTYFLPAMPDNQRRRRFRHDLRYDTQIPPELQGFGPLGMLHAGEDQELEPSDGGGRIRRTRTRRGLPAFPVPPQSIGDLPVNLDLERESYGLPQQEAVEGITPGQSRIARSLPPEPSVDFERERPRQLLPALEPKVDQEVEQQQPGFWRRAGEAALSLFAPHAYRLLIGQPRQRRFEEQQEVRQARREREAQLDKKIDEYTDEQGRRVLVFQTPEGDIYEQPMGKQRVQPLRENPQQAFERRQQEMMDADLPELVKSRYVYTGNFPSFSDFEEAFHAEHGRFPTEEESIAYERERESKTVGEAQAPGARA